MKRWGRYAAAVAMAAFFAACAGTQLPASRGAATGAASSPASSGDLLYVAGESTLKATVFILSYPQGQLVGSFAMGATGMCSDSNGNVFLTARDAVIEYAHGGTTPIQTLRIPGATTYDCSVDATTGNLAVSFYCPPCDYQNLAIFPDASGKPTEYLAPVSFATTLGYDDAGNLFLAPGGSGLVELPSGSGTFKSISLNEDIGEPGTVQWDGKYITLQGLVNPGGIYRIAVSGSTGTVVGATKFARQKKRIGYSWISDGTVAFPFSEHGDQTNELGIWKYPRGGPAMHIIKKIAQGDSGFGALTVSVAPKR